MFNLTVAGAIHTVLACLGIAVGVIQFLRLKGDALHRALGYGYVYGLLVADGAAMLIYQFTGKLNILHFGAVTNMICIAFGMWPVLRSPRRSNWRMKHYKWISWSYVGLLAAAATEVIVRTIPFANQRQVWMATAVATFSVTLAGYLLIERNRPIART